MFQSITTPLVEQVIYVPEESMITDIVVKRGDQVEKGKRLMQLDSPKLGHQIATTENEKNTVEREIHFLGMKDKTRTYLGQKEVERAAYEALSKQLRAQKEHLSLEDKENGRLYEWNADSTQAKIIFYIPDTDVGHIKEDDEVDFIISKPRSEYKGKIVRISPTSNPLLQHLALASHNVLPLVKDPHQGVYRFVESHYAVEVKIENSKERPLLWGVVGEAKVTGRWYSILFEFGWRVSRIFWHESGA